MTHKAQLKQWVSWRQGYMGVWSVAHLYDTQVDGFGKTSCGQQIPDNAERASDAATRCRKCESVLDADERTKQAHGVARDEDGEPVMTAQQTARQRPGDWD